MRKERKKKLIKGRVFNEEKTKGKRKQAID